MTEPRMTLEQFRAIKVYCGDLGAALNDSHWAPEEAPGIGWLYMGRLYIETLPPGSPHRWMLTIGNDSEMSNDLAGLERKLYEFAVSEGYIAAEGKPNAI
jgi:hypothetical protein